MSRILFFLAIPIALFLSFTIWKGFEAGGKTVPEKSELAKTAKNLQEQQTKVIENREKQFLFENVSFTYETSLFSNVKGTVVLASALEDPTEKPDNVYPKHIDLIFEKSYTGKQSSGEDYFLSPRAQIYPVDEFKAAYSFYQINLEPTFKELKGILSQNATRRLASGAEELVYIPFADAHQAFNARSKVIDFQGGRGLLFLTQWQQDAILINNSRLLYVFQGLTSDNKHFVLMEFPVSVESLPANDDAKYTGKYQKLNDTSDFLGKSYQQLYRKYAQETAGELDKMSPEKFAPNLDKIENLIRSLRIK